jgi:hypothetical protein
MKNYRVSLLLLALAEAALAQTPVPKAEVIVTNTGTAQTFQTVTDEKGHWFIASFPTGACRASGRKRIRRCYGRAKATKESPAGLFQRPPPTATATNCFPLTLYVHGVA